MAFNTEALPRLSERVFRLLRYGDEHNSYGSDPFRVATAIIAEAARVGVGAARLRWWLADLRNAGGQWYRDRLEKEGRCAADRQLEHLYGRSADNYRSPFGDATDVRQRLAEIERRALETPWAGRAGATRQKLFLAHVHVAMKAGKLTYRASERQIADAAGVSPGTVRQRHRELLDAKLLRRRESGAQRQGTTWNLRDDACVKTDAVGPTSTPSTTAARLATHPSFRYGTGLDGRIWCYLDSDAGSTSRDVSIALRMDHRSVRRKLAALEAHGLADRFDDGTWTRAGDRADLDRVAEATGAADRQQRQVERHRRERSDYRAQTTRDDPNPSTDGESQE